MLLGSPFALYSLSSLGIERTSSRCPLPSSTSFAHDSPARYDMVRRIASGDGAGDSPSAFRLSWQAAFAALNSIPVPSARVCRRSRTDPIGEPVGELKGEGEECKHAGVGIRDGSLRACARSPVKSCHTGKQRSQLGQAVLEAMQMSRLMATATTRTVRAAASHPRRCGILPRTAAADGRSAASCSPRCIRPCAIRL